MHASRTDTTWDIQNTMEGISSDFRKHVICFDGDDAQLFPFQKNVPLAPAATRALEKSYLDIRCAGKMEAG
jgi:hypothetical protein